VGRTLGREEGRLRKRLVVMARKNAAVGIRWTQIMIGRHGGSSL